MDLSTLFKALRTYRWVMLVGVAVAVVASFAAGFTIVDGKPQLRAQAVYNSATNLLIGQPNTSEFQSELQSRSVAEGKTAPVQRDLSSLAVIYAYMASGDAVEKQVESQIGALQPGESITAAQRTTQPAGNEKNPGRYSLPIIQIVGTASTPARADEIAGAAATAFTTYVAGRQDAQKVAADNRVQFSTLESPQATLSDDSSNPYIPIVATAAGVLFAFLALTLILFNVRGRRTEETADAPAESPAADSKLPQPAVGWARTAESQS